MTTQDKRDYTKLCNKVRAIQRDLAQIVTDEDAKRLIPGYALKHLLLALDNINDTELN